MDKEKPKTKEENKAALNPNSSNAMDNHPMAKFFSHSQECKIDGTMLQTDEPCMMKINAKASSTKASKETKEVLTKRIGTIYRCKINKLECSALFCPKLKGIKKDGV